MVQDIRQMLEKDNPYRESLFDSWAGTTLFLATDYSLSDYIINKMKDMELQPFYNKRERIKEWYIGAYRDKWYTSAVAGQRASVLGTSSPVSSPPTMEGIRKAMTEKVYAKFRPPASSSYSGLRSMFKTYTFVGAMTLAAQGVVSAIRPRIGQVAEKKEARLFEPIAYDSPAAYTQRQRAIMAIHDSQLGIQNVIGSEAGYFHK